MLAPGALRSLIDSLRRPARRHDLTTVIACAFDHRTRMLPFVIADKKMAPAGVRAIGSAMLEAGFTKTRIVLQQWNPRFRPSQMRLDGRVPDVFMVSSMQIHTAEAKALIRDACRIDPAHRPLIIAGGAKAIYEPWDLFSLDPADPWGADVVVTGEEYVLLSLLEVLCSLRAGNEPLRSTFTRARNSGMIDEIPGLVYPITDGRAVVQELVDTGIQRLLGDLDELPSPEGGYMILEPPSREPTLGSRPIRASLVGHHTPIASLVLTFGCKFACPYCPIPAYNQRQHRVKSGERIAEEMHLLYTRFGIRRMFGADDNFFNEKNRTLSILETLAKYRCDGVRLRKRIRWGTEVTVHDTLKLRDHLRLARDAGIRALWLGVEDLTATLVKKGQNVAGTLEAFQLLTERGICPMPMMMHYDDQPLYTRGRPNGLLNQARMLRKAGAVSLQVLMMTPATGSKSYAEAFNSGMVYESVDGRKVETYMLDANYVVASRHPKPWRKQLNILAAYMYFYNPLRFAIALIVPRSRLYLADAGMQVVGMLGLMQTLRRTFGWAMRLRRGRIRRRTGPPASTIPMRSVNGEAASHALPGTPLPILDHAPHREYARARG
ncbi:MAG: radical SAM protein [Planctomycetes bacterium]|nr:radical SAM protein [Planctomycetota bacterium]